jgi:hypothetical protein
LEWCSALRSNRFPYAAPAPVEQIPFFRVIEICEKACFPGGVKKSDPACLRNERIQAYAVNNLKHRTETRIQRLLSGTKL